MSAANDHGTNGGEGPSESGSGTKGLPIEFVRHLLEAAVTLSGELTPSARVQVALRSTPGRHQILDDLCHEICPSDVDPVAWSRWLAGGRPPILERPLKPELRKPTGPKERPANLVSRTTARVADQVDAVELARAKLAQEQEHLLMLRAHDNAAVHFLVVNQLVSLLEPVFAMGPAWTIMRSLSGYLPATAAAEATEYLSTKEKEMVLQSMAAERKSLTEKMLEVLDFFSGVEAFEEALRGAVANVCKDFDGRRDEQVKDGRRPRSKERLKTEVHPKAQHEVAEVLGGLKQAS